MPAKLMSSKKMEGVRLLFEVDWLLVDTGRVIRQLFSDKGIKKGSFGCDRDVLVEEFGLKFGSKSYNEAFNYVFSSSGFANISLTNPQSLVARTNCGSITRDEMIEPHAFTYCRKERLHEYAKGLKRDYKFLTISSLENYKAIEGLVQKIQPHIILVANPHTAAHLARNVSMEDDKMPYILIAEIDENKDMLFSESIEKVEYIYGSYPYDIWNKIETRVEELCIQIIEEEAKDTNEDTETADKTSSKSP